MADWLAIIIVVLIIGILIDGFRRMIVARRAELRLSKNVEKTDSNDVHVSNSEFPNGGARVVSVRDEGDSKSLNKTVKDKFQAAKSTLGAIQKIPEQVSLKLEESVPMLMDSVDNLAEKTEPKEPEIGSLEELEESEDELVDIEDEPIEDRPLQVEEAVAQEPVETEDVEYREPDEVIIVNVMAKTSEQFAGEDLLQVLTNCGLKFGDMNIFHRQKDNDADGPILFSLANIVVPGTFNLAQMKEFNSPGVSMFLSLPVDADSLEVFEDLISTAKTIAEFLGGELKDENRSVMTQQTIEHGRQRVIEYERKKKLSQSL